MSWLIAVVFTTRACLMPCAVGYDNAVSSVVDIFNVLTGTWSTAALFQARHSLAAASLPNAGVAIFAGGYCTSCYLCVRCCRMGMSVRGVHEWVECGCVLRREPVSCLVQWQLIKATPMSWTSSTWRLELGALQPSARPGAILQPRRCRMPESRSLLAAIVRPVTFVWGAAGWV